jgi:selenocysteine lyase/cysteine desulfurase
LAALLVADPSEIVLTAGLDAALALAERIGGPEGAVLDASLTVGAAPLEAGATGADLIAFACDKWLLAPEQTAALWISPRLGAAALGVAPSSGLARTAVLGLARSVGWLEMYVGLEWLYERTRRLVERLAAAVAVGGVEVVRSAPAVIDFRLPAWPTDMALDELRRRVFTIIELTPDRSAIRAAVAWFNTEDEIDRFASAVRELAAHTPDSLPRRPPLIVR